MNKLSLLFALFLISIIFFSCMQDAPSEVPKGILKITSPLANDNFAIGDTVHIQADAVMLEMSKVDFFVDGALKGSDTNAPYNFDLLTADMSVDKHIIKAFSYGEGGCIEQSVSINLAVGVPPVVNVTSPADGAFIELGTNYNITATATDSDGTITEVRFYINDVLKNTDTTFPYSYSWNTAGLTVGSYIIKIIAKDNRREESEKSITANLAIKPTVTTAAISNISYTTAIGGGDVTATGGASIMDRGVCWSTDGLPLVSGSHTIDGTGAGAFVSSLSGLTEGVRYIIRAYAMNSIGTSYGDTLSFRTLEIPTPAGFKKVLGGTFQMGNTSINGATPVHSVTLSTYFMGIYEVTQLDWVATMGTNPAWFTDNLNRPIERVSWYDILVFCNKKSILDGLTPCYTISGSTDPAVWGAVPTTTNTTWNTAICNWSANGYRMPTEAEWEYAARGGKNSQGYTYSGSNTIGDVTWYSVNSSSTTHPVGTKAPNELGLYDMSGNVWEKNWDWYADYSATDQNNPTGAVMGSFRIYRGGSFPSAATSCRVANRSNGNPYYRDNGIGFRLVRSP